MRNSKFQEKAAQPKRNKKELSRAFRLLRVQQGADMNKSFCDECGFRIRGENHLNGAHHNGRVPDCHRR